MLRWVNAEYVLQVLRAFRVVWLKGRFGGGKTLLSFALGREFLERGWSRYLISNIGSAWSDKVENVEPRDTKLDVFVIVDEAGQFLQTNSQIDTVMAYARMMNVVAVMPSVMPIPVRARFLSIIRVFNAYGIGLPFWIYRLDLSYAGQTERTHFALLKPHEYYGVYDTESFAADDAGIGLLMRRWANVQIEVKRLDVRRSGAIEIPTGLGAFEDDQGAGRDGPAGVAGGATASDEPIRALEGIRGVAESFEGAAEVFEQSVSVLQRQRKGRRL